MHTTLGFHVTKSTYGTWLPGDRRGSWSEGWSPERGYYGAYQLHDGDARRERMARRRMKHAPVILSDKMAQAIVESLGECVQKSQGGLRIVAAAIEPTHMHLLIPNAGRDIGNTAKWIADQTTKKVHQTTDHQGPVWTKNSWCDHIDDQDHWENAILYIDGHNTRAGRGSRPYAFLAPVEI